MGWYRKRGQWRANGGPPTPLGSSCQLNTGWAVVGRTGPARPTAAMQRPTPAGPPSPSLQTKEKKREGKGKEGRKEGLTMMSHVVQRQFQLNLKQTGQRLCLLSE